MKSTNKPKQPKKKTSKKTGSTPKLSFTVKPEDMTLEQWQIALRQYSATHERFVIAERDRKDFPGHYTVKSPASKREYRVVFRGEDSPWNYCSCMDFKTSQLGTCKHIEALKYWMAENGKRVCRRLPSNTSLYLSYKKEERKVCLRIGTDHAEEFEQLAKGYFDTGYVVLPEKLLDLTDFIRKASEIDNTFRCYPDVMDFIVEKRDYNSRCALLETLTEGHLDHLLHVPLYPYQKQGIRFAFRAGKSIIADEMGLGKTIQAIGTAELMKKFGLVSSVLVVCPTSLKYQWKKEIERFTDSTAIVIEGGHLKRKAMYQAGEFYKIVSYNSVSNDIRILRTLRTDMLIMDEVQRLKNWNTQISQSARRIDADYSVVLSGTPLENKLEELYSIMQFVDQYCLGPYYRFMHESVLMNETGKVLGYKNLNAIGERMKDVLLRRRKCDVALQLPERIDKIQFVPMTTEQQGIHDELTSYVSQLVSKWARMHFLSEKDRKRLLLLLGQMRMVCDSTYILDQHTRYDTKVDETMQILKNVFENGDEKVVIFSQWERMTRLIAAEMDKIGIRYEYLHGGIPSEKRKDLTENFTNDPEIRVFISTDAGSTGLNLQVASLLINIDLPWNPAVLEQRIARIYRIGQKRNIQVINLVSSGTIEERMLSTLNFKSSMFEGILDGGGDTVMIEDSKFDKIMDSVKTMTDSFEQPQKEHDTIVADETEEEASESVEPSESANSTSDNPASPQEIVQQGISFLSGISKILQSPEATKDLVDSLVITDEKTGKTSLNIPVPDKESVVNILSTFAKLFAK